MARYARSEAAVQVVDGGEEELRRHHSGLIDGDIARGGGFQQLFRRMHPAADDDAGNVEGEVLFEHLTAYFRFKVLQIRHFDLADDLWTLKWEIFIEAAELHTRTVQVGGADIPFRLRGRGQHRQLKRLGKVGCLYHRKPPKYYAKSVKKNPLDIPRHAVLLIRPADGKAHALHVLAPVAHAHAVRSIE